MEPRFYDNEDNDLQENKDLWAAQDKAFGEVRNALHSLMDWLYRTLEKEYEYHNSDEQIEESIRINEYEFDEDGNRWRY
jgi:hypothetical protein